MSLPSRQFFSSPLGQRWLFGLLYMSEGAPMGFIWWALPTLLADRGFSLETDYGVVFAADAALGVSSSSVGRLLISPCAVGSGCEVGITVCQICMMLTLLPLAFSRLVAELQPDCCHAFLAFLAVRRCRTLLSIPWQYVR